MEPYTSYSDKRTKLTAAAALTALLLLPGAGCAAKDTTPPVIQEYGIYQDSETMPWVVEGENISFKVRTLDDRGTEQVCIQFTNGSKTNLAKKSHTQKADGEEANWEADFKLPAGSYEYNIMARDKVNETETNVLREITVYPNYGISSNDEIKYSLDPSKPHPVAKYLLDKNLGIYIPQLEILDNGTLDKNKKAFIDLLPGMDKNFAKYVVDNKFTFENGEISDLELNVLTDPANQNYIQQLFGQYISDASKVNPELAAELENLPDLKNIQINGIKKLEGLEDVVVLAGNQKYTTIFGSMLDEGIKGKREVCTPLEASLIIACSKEFGEEYKSLKNYRAWRFKLMHDVWTKELDTYREDIWEDFDKATERLDSVNLLTAYGGSHIFYQNYPGGASGVKSPSEVFKSGNANCADMAKFNKFCLNKSGYDCRGLIVNFDKALPDGATGHAVCLYNENNLFYYIDSDWITYGPFKTIQEVAVSSAGRWNRKVASYETR